MAEVVNARHGTRDMAEDGRGWQGSRREPSSHPIQRRTGICRAYTVASRSGSSFLRGNRNAV